MGENRGFSGIKPVTKPGLRTALSGTVLVKPNIKKSFQFCQKVVFSPYWPYHKANDVQGDDDCEERGSLGSNQIEGI